jgi:hypothetical protein
VQPPQGDGGTAVAPDEVNQKQLDCLRQAGVVKQLMFTMAPYSREQHPVIAVHEALSMSDLDVERDLPVANQPVVVEWPHARRLMQQFRNATNANQLRSGCAACGIDVWGTDITQRPVVTVGATAALEVLAVPHEVVAELVDSVLCEATARRLGFLALTDDAIAFLKPYLRNFCVYPPLTKYVDYCLSARRQRRWHGDAHTVGVVGTM